MKYFLKIDNLIMIANWQLKISVFLIMLINSWLTKQCRIHKDPPIISIRVESIQLLVSTPIF
jgi:hypothetical protein